MTDNAQELDEILNSGDGFLHCCGDYEGEAKQAVLDWHNKQVEAVLDRLEQVHRANPLWVGMTQRVIPLSAIEAERKRLGRQK